MKTITDSKELYFPVIQKKQVVKLLLHDNHDTLSGHVKEGCGR